MNNKIVSLTKVFLKNSFNSAYESDTKKLKRKKINNTILYVLLVLYLGGIVSFLSFPQIIALKALGQEQSFLGLLFVAIVIIMLIQSIMSSINVLYFSKDVEFILQLPISPKQIVISKMNVIFITQYFTELIMGLPSLIIYGILTNAGFVYYLFALIVLICLPILPILLGTLLVMIIMSFTKFSKNKDRFQVITSMIMVLIILAIQMSLTGNNLDDTQITNKIISFSSMFDKIGVYFVTLEPSINALTNSNILPSLIYILQLLAITIISFIVFIEISKVLYFKGATTSNSGSTTRIKNNNINYKKNKIAFSYIKKELIMLFKNPIFNMQCIMPSILMPIIFIVMIFIQKNNIENGLDIISALSENGLTMVMIYLIGFNVFVEMITMIAVTAFSRDGENANFVKYVPVPLYNQFIYKIMPAFIMNLVSFVIIAIAFIIITKIKFLAVILPAFVITMLINIIINYFSGIVDLKHPKLQWNSEYEVVKQNMNMLYPMILVFLILGVLVFLGIVLNTLNLWVSSIIMVILFMIPAIIINKYVYKNQIKLFEKII